MGTMVIGWMWGMTKREERRMFPKLLGEMSGWRVAPPVEKERNRSCSRSGEKNQYACYQMR